MNTSDLEQLFKEIDTNHSGRVNLREFKLYMKNHEGVFSEKAAEKYFDQADLNDDHLITLEELKSAFGSKDKLSDNRS
ncbi:unnamed protein product [Calicophoron daubneyi]|uniref:EF-hand domain-containing protein n=1 Tax=Calicophoron daubneyi TaxID=300641 RepID=A0AAV2TTN6_CALDB